MRNVRVCHVTSSHETNDVRIFQKECLSLASAGYDVYLIGPGESRKEGDVTIVGTKYRGQSRIKRFLIQPCIAYHRARKLKCDIYHLHDPELVPYIPFFKKIGKVIFDSHEDILGDDYNREWIWKPIQKYIATIMTAFLRIYLKRADVLISVSPQIVKRLKNVNPNVYMVTNYPCYIEKPNYISEKKKYDLCFTGTISDMYNIEKVLGILDNISDINFVLCGPINDEYLQRLKKHKSWSQVDYKGLVSHEEVEKIQGMSKIGLAVFNKWSGTGWDYGSLGVIKLFEYLMAGLPVVCTDFILWKNIMSQYNCGICVNPESEVEIENAILELLGDDAKRKQMGELGQEAIKNDYNWRNQAQILVSIYNNMIG